MPCPAVRSASCWSTSWYSAVWDASSIWPIFIEYVEKLVDDYYTRVQIRPAQQDALAGMLHHEFDRLMAAETEELERLTTNRDRLEGEQDRLLQAHYTDAIPLPVLKREQDRIVAELDQVTRRIDAHHGDYADARAHLDEDLGLLANCADIYTRCDDTNRRLCTRRSSPRSSSSRTTSHTSSTTDPSRCSSIRRSTPTP